MICNFFVALHIDKSYLIHEYHGLGLLLSNLKNLASDYQKYGYRFTAFTWIVI